MYNQQQTNYYQSNYKNDFEMNLNENHNDKLAGLGIEMRLGFIKKVYGILSLQLLMTTIFCIISMTSSSFKIFHNHCVGIT